MRGSCLETWSARSTKEEKEAIFSQPRGTISRARGTASNLTWKAESAERLRSGGWLPSRPWSKEIRFWLAGNPMDPTKPQTVTLIACLIGSIGLLFPLDQCS